MAFDRMIMRLASLQRDEQAASMTSLVVGPALATALVASVADPRAFRSGRRLLGLDRARAEAALERREGQARRHQQAGRPLPAQPVRGRARWP